MAKKPARVIIEQNYLSDSYLDYLNELKALHEAAGNEYDISKRAVFVCAVFVEDSVYEEFLAEHKLEKENYANPSSMYDPAHISAQAIEKAREQVADLLGVKNSKTILFFSAFYNLYVLNKTNFHP